MNKSARKVKLELKKASKELENAQVEKREWINPCFTSCHALIYTSFLSLTISLLCRISREEEEDLEH